MPKGHTPGLLSSDTRQHAISARYAAQGGEELAIQSASLATTTLNSSDTHPKQRRQFLISIASAPSTPDALESFDATHVTSSYVKLRSTISGTSPYLPKATHMVFSTWGTCISG